MNSQEEKWYANAIHGGTIDMKDIAREMAHSSRRNYGEVMGTLIDFMETLPTILKNGQSVKLGDFGTMRISLSSEGSDTEKEFDTRTIKAKLILTLGKEIKNELKTINYKRSQ